LSGIRTHDPSVRASEDNLCLRRRGHCDRHLRLYTSYLFRFAYLLCRLKPLYELCKKKFLRKLSDLVKQSAYTIKRIMIKFNFEKSAAQISLQRTCSPSNSRFNFFKISLGNDCSVFLSLAASNDYNRYLFSANACCHSKTQVPSFHIEAPLGAHLLISLRRPLSTY
jgi:hypothetical protein